MNKVLAVWKSYVAYFRALLRRRRKAAADEQDDPFIYPHS